MIKFPPKLATSGDDSPPKIMVAGWPVTFRVTTSFTSIYPLFTQYLFIIYPVFTHCSGWITSFTNLKIDENSCLAVAVHLLQECTLPADGPREHTFARGPWSIKCQAAFRGFYHCRLSEWSTMSPSSFSNRITTKFHWHFGCAIQSLHTSRKSVCQKLNNFVLTWHLGSFGKSLVPSVWTQPVEKTDLTTHKVRWENLLW